MFGFDLSSAAGSNETDRTKVIMIKTFLKTLSISFIAVRVTFEYASPSLLNEGHHLPFAHESFSATVRLNTAFWPGI